MLTLSLKSEALSSARDSQCVCCLPSTAALNAAVTLFDDPSRVPTLRLREALELTDKHCMTLCLADAATNFQFEQ